jgi:hypothetical protein
MNTFRIGFVIAVVCALTFGTTIAFAQDTSAREKDRVEIEELMWRYTRALDTGDGTTYAATYTVDGQFGTGATATKGREALKKLVMDASRNPARRRELRCIIWKPSSGLSSSIRIMPNITRTTSP